MRLRKGITGFWGSGGKEGPIAEIDLKETHSTFLSLNGSDGFVLKGVDDDQYSQNYVRYKLIQPMKDYKFDVLVNTHYPVYCGVTEDSSWMNLKFIEFDLALRKIFEPKLEFLSPQYLNSEVNENDLVSLSSAERSEIEFWKSKTFGEIIFNGYD